MSIEARRQLVNSPNTLFQNDSQRSDFLDANITKTETVAQVLWLIKKHHILEFTAVKSDHHDDRADGERCHFNGYAFDCWPLVTAKAGDYADASSPQMTSFVRDVMSSPWTYQLGLAGSAQTDELCAAAGYPNGFPTDTNRLFEDSGFDHLHVGCEFQ